MLAVLLVRHAEPVSPDSGLGIAAPTAVYSSPYPRAVQTVKPIARRHVAPPRISGDLLGSRRRART